MEDSSARPIPWALFVSELIGTALLVLVGLSLVILMFGAGSPMARLIPNEGLRRLITGFLFGTTGGCIALSPVGKVSGAHINPVVTLAFRLMGKLDLRTTLGYIGAQLFGAVVGSLPGPHEVCCRMRGVDERVVRQRPFPRRDPIDLGPDRQHRIDEAVQLGL